MGRYSHYLYTINTEINRFDRYGHNAALIQMMVTAAKKRLFRNLTFKQLSKRLKHIEFELNYGKLILCKKTMVHITQVIILLEH